MNFIRPARVHHRPLLVRPTWVPRIVSIIRYLPVDRILRAVWEVIVLRPRKQKHTKNAPPCTTYMNLPLRQPRPILRRRMKLRGNADLENIQQSLLRDGPFGQRAAAAQRFCHLGEHSQLLHTAKTGSHGDPRTTSQKSECSQKPSKRWTFLARRVPLNHGPHRNLGRGSHRHYRSPQTRS